MPIWKNKFGLHSCLIASNIIFVLILKHVYCIGTASEFVLIKICHTLPI